MQGRNSSAASDWVRKRKEQQERAAEIRAARGGRGAGAPSGANTFEIRSLILSCDLCVGLEQAEHPHQSTDGLPKNLNRIHWSVPCSPACIVWCSSLCAAAFLRRTICTCARAVVAI